MYVPGAAVAPAVTVLEGYAVCSDHLGYVAQGTRWQGILEAVRHRGYVDTSGSF
jgi:hypothetical protein